MSCYSTWIQMYVGAKYKSIEVIDCLPMAKATTTHNIHLLQSYSERVCMRFGWTLSIIFLWSHPQLFNDSCLIYFYSLHLYHLKYRVLYLFVEQINLFFYWTLRNILLSLFTLILSHQNNWNGPCACGIEQRG
jgi:hypothetical protein